MKNYVAYYRVSTAKQGSSGLGLEAQREAIQRFLGNAPIIAEYTEIESGSKNNRAELDKAILRAKNDSATLVIAKLDRLSRNVSFIFALRDAKVDFICADMPDANTMTIGIFAALAQHERELISYRTKAALQAKKAQGYTLGKPQNLTHDARKKGAQSIALHARTNDHNKRVCAIIRNLHEQQMPLPRIARFLNESGFQTIRGKRFHSSTVRYLMQLTITPNWLNTMAMPLKSEALPLV